MSFSTLGRPKRGLYALLCAIMLMASAAMLFMALSTDIIISRFVEVGELVRTLYPEGDYLADNPGDSAKDYEAMVQVMENGTTMLLGLSQRAQNIYQELTTPTGYTVGAGALQLWQSGDYAPALLIFLFSIALPILKTLCMVFVFVEPFLNRGRLRSAGILKLLNLSHKYTILDVFVVSVTVFAFSKNTLVTIVPAQAVGWYIGYMAVSYLALGLLTRSAK